MKKSHLILCLCLIAFGVGVVWQLVSLYIKTGSWLVFLAAVPLLVAIAGLIWGCLRFSRWRKRSHEK